MKRLFILSALALGLSYPAMAAPMPDNMTGSSDQSTYPPPDTSQMTSQDSDLNPILLPQNRFVHGRNDNCHKKQ
jgi:hypothetical protein